MLIILAAKITPALASDCTTKEYIMNNWSGQCINGKVNGEGSGRAVYSADNYSIDVVGKFKVHKNGAYKTGFYFEDWGNGQSKKIKVYKINESASDPYEFNKEILSSICIEGCKPYITKDSIWASNGNRNEVLDKSAESRVPLEQLINIVYSNLQKQSIDSMDPATFKSFLFADQTKAVVAEKQKLLDMADDPPVVGIRLSLSGEGGSTVKTKKKSKKKN